MIRLGGKLVYLCFGYADMRKSISGLMTLVKHSFSLDRCAEALFVYTTEAGNSFLFLVVVQILMYYTIYVYILILPIGGITLT